mmetsp:Transcript_11013/g.34002  ORF Transcript_11013/g.34002 Transcript_11013/m.34002 type:complete len:242 (-) Transcript_11013:281-1006(-)|eukprot:scaffold68515_cov32-Tisochrysis_lutea.AAC.2
MVAASSSMSTCSLVSASSNRAIDRAAAAASFLSDVAAASAASAVRIARASASSRALDSIGTLPNSPYAGVAPASVLEVAPLPYKSAAATGTGPCSKSALRAAQRLLAFDPAVQSAQRASEAIGRMATSMTRASDCAPFTFSCRRWTARLIASADRVSPNPSSCCVTPSASGSSRASAERSIGRARARCCLFCAMARSDQMAPSVAMVTPPSTAAAITEKSGSASVFASPMMVAIGASAVIH